MYLLDKGETCDKMRMITKNTAKVYTVINYIFSSILWLLGVLTLLFNILGLWAHWNLAGFGFVFYIPFPAITQILAIVFSCIEKNKKMMIMNFISLAISIAFVLLTFLASSKWFWDF